MISWRRIAACDNRAACRTRVGLALCVVALLGTAGCSSMASWMPTIPVPNFDWLFGSSKKPTPLPEFKASVTPQVVWQTLE